MRWPLTIYRWSQSPKEYRELSRIGQGDTVLAVTAGVLKELAPFSIEEIFSSDEECYIDWNAPTDRHVLPNGDMVVIFKRSADICARGVA